MALPAVRYVPLRDINRTIDEFWDKGWDLFPNLGESGSMDMYEEDGNLVAEISLPAFNKSELRVTAREGILEIEAEHEDTDENRTKRHYFLHESSSHYHRRVSLPGGVDENKASAEFKNGRLRIVMPIETTKSIKNIDVK